MKTSLSKTVILKPKAEESQVEILRSAQDDKYPNNFTSKSFRLIAFFCSFVLIFGCAREWNVFSIQEKYVFNRIRQHWETWMPSKKADGTAPLISFEELYQGLGEEEQIFLDRMRAINPAPLTPEKNTTFQRIEGQAYKKEGKIQTLGPQYLPKNVFEAYEEMMRAMQKDLGKRLLVDSGYRSPAYQLYTFLFFLPKHHFSIKETREWVALPGHSEHGTQDHQAIDFMNEEGINGDTRAEDFEALPEYHWLQDHARDFSFKLSYPRGTKGTTFEPWHWRYEGKNNPKMESKPF